MIPANEHPLTSDPRREVLHHLRNAFQVIVRKMFDTPNSLTTDEVLKAIQIFIQRIKQTPLNEVPEDVKQEIIQVLQPLTKIANLSVLIEKFKTFYCQYDPDTCNRLKNPKPQRSLI